MAVVVGAESDGLSKRQYWTGLGLIVGFRILATCCVLPRVVYLGKRRGFRLWIDDCLIVCASVCLFLKWYIFDDGSWLTLIDTVLGPSCCGDPS